MTDNFTLLDEPRRPWLDIEALRSKFLSLAAASHPDRTHNAGAAVKLAATAQYTALNTAHNCLRDPKERLHHLLMLERGTPPASIQRLPSELMELFLAVGRLCRDTDKFLAEKAAVTAPMLKVQLLERSLEWTDRLNALQQQINARHAALDEELRGLNVAWESAPPVGSPARPTTLPLERLERIYRDLSYAQRWSAQLQERAVPLAF